ncbi:ubiquinol-cytochrome c reductase core subunit 1 [Paramarasmius palmivorus]|uniref:Cytochrome b-c1 complex subunit 2, mitochondrial n=1 Tax=Paramarasmius palmivorus TaxID=297713 RepID=A0AAW0D4M2_9AGAR
MLATRASSRNAQRLARSFATVVDSAGVKVAAVDTNQPTSSVTLLVKAGSRFEPKAGVAHGLKNFAFRSTGKRSALGTVRESELYGGVLSASLSREYLALTAEFLRGDEQHFVDVLTSFITAPKFTRHEFLEYVSPVIEGEIEATASNPGAQALELAHALAFRQGLGSSLFAAPHSHLTEEDIKAFAKSAFTKSNVAVVGTGIDQESLSKLVQQSLSNISSSTTSSPASSYFGGETRVQSHAGLQTVFVGYGAAGAPLAELATLAAHVSPAASVKWSQGLSPIASAVAPGTTVQSVYLPYSDATLFGFLVQGQDGASVKAAGKAAVEALKAASGGVKGDDLKKAIAKAKFATASAAESREGLVATLGAKILAGSDSSLASALSSLDAVSESALAKAASSLVSAKPTYVAVGDIASLPYADELGL